ncbi:PLP-dependent cysteine synthase family protein [Geomonas subterranea]|uniref:cysteine synthase n=1 Tax=Geomonas subterranea TaxID=2847989 RepID=A0ABX8LLP4_9BACT|nr:MULTISPECIES: cysteine synthase family protein [Geomonas]QXE92946.1 cysteine synthase family protein [Geomonas subterranea]QXM08948.1 cysteine synthase family protein [Geomonas subterranea]
MKGQSLINSIGSTPLIEIDSLCDNPSVRIMAKLEGSNPGGSVKDRPARHMILAAEKSGELTVDKVILEPTSGNTGIALAMIAAARGYRIKLVMPACVSMERRSVLEAYGAEIVLSPGCEATDGAIRLAHKIFEEHPGKYYMPNQYANPNNVLAHYETTGPEIWRQTDGRVTHMVAGMGTGGTLMGLSRYFRETAPQVQVVGVEPVLGHKIQGLKNMQEAIVPPIYDASAYHRKLVVEDDDAFETARLLAAQHGIFCGMSGGAAVFGALRLAKELESGTIVVILPDRGDRYLSTNLFKSMCAQCPP